MRTASLVICGLLIGVAATGFGLWLGSAGAGGEGPGTAAETTTTTTAAAPEAEPVWDEVGETRIDSTLIIPGELSVSADGEARLMYELRSIAQQYPATLGPYPAALPAVWLLTTVSGTTVPGETDPPNPPQTLETGTPPLRDSVSFALPEGTGADDIATVEVVEWRLAAPIEAVVTLPSTPGASFQMMDDSVVTLATILEQSNGTIFDFDLERPVDPWRVEQSQQFFGPDHTFQAVGDGWSSASFTLGTGFQITWQGDTAPAEIPIRVSTIEWVPVTGSRLVRPAVIDG
jgi:hypothetical protein